MKILKEPMNGQNEFTYKSLNEKKSITIIVGEQVGWSLVSEYKIGNTYIERIAKYKKKPKYKK